MKSGVVYIESEELENFDISDPTAIGVVAGYHFGKGVSAEFEMLDTKDAHFGFGGAQGSIGLKTQALYFAYRSQGTFFLKGRIGVLREEVTASAYGCYNCTASEDDTGLSLGGGVGFNFGDIVQLEAEYTLIEADADMLSIGLNLRF